MKTIHSIRLPLLLALLAAACLSATGYASLVFDVKVDTSAFAGSPAAPFFIDFQLNDGSGIGDGNNTVTISNFSFLGGQAQGSPLAPFGGASGDLYSSVVITDSAFLNEFTQQFTPGGLLQFRVSLLSTNVDLGPTPDAFSFSILDGTLSPVPTVGLGDTLVLLNLDSPDLNIQNVQSFGADTSRTPAAGGPAIPIPAPLITAVPEPGTALAGLLMASLAGFRPMRRRG